MKSKAKWGVSPNTHVLLASAFLPSKNLQNLLYWALFCEPGSECWAKAGRRRENLSLECSVEQNYNIIEACSGL